MSEEINHDRRHFFGTVTMTIDAAQFGTFGWRKRNPASQTQQVWRGV